MNRAERRASKMPKTGAFELEKVTLGYIHPGDVSELFFGSVLDMVEYEAVVNHRILGRIGKRSGSGWIAAARNWVTSEFLKTDSQWLLFVDSDMGFAPNALHRMEGVAKADGLKPIIGGLCFSLTITDVDPVTSGHTFECFPTIGMWNRNEAGEILGYHYVTEYDSNKVLKVDSSGAAMVLIHRSAFEAIGTEGWWTPLETPDGANLIQGKGHFSEDVSFYIRCAEAGLPVWLDTATKTAHDKGGIHITEQTWDFQQAIKAASANMKEVPAPLETAGDQPDS